MDRILQEYGLSEKEERIYIECLKRGPCTAYALSAAAGLQRSTTYDNLESLKRKGMVTSLLRGRTQHFEAVDPAEFLTLHKEKEMVLRAAIPKLKKLRGTATKQPIIRQYEGAQGILTLLDIIYQEKELRIYGSAANAEAALRHVPKSFARRRQEEGVILYAVLERSPQAQFRIKDPLLRRITRLRYLSEFRSLKTVTFVAGDHVAILTLQEVPAGIHITDGDVARTQRLIFDRLWQSAAPAGKR